MRDVIKVGEGVTPAKGFYETIEEFYEENWQDEGESDKIVEAATCILYNGCKKLAMVENRLDDEGWSDTELVVINSSITKEESDEIFEFLHDRGGYHSVMKEWGKSNLKGFDEFINNSGGLVMFSTPEVGMRKVFPMNTAEEVVK